MSSKKKKYWKSNVEKVKTAINFFVFCFFFCFWVQNCNKIETDQDWNPMSKCQLTLGLGH